MRKILCCAIGAACMLSCAGLSSCGVVANDKTTYTLRAEYFADTQTLSAEMTADIVNPAGCELSELKFQLWPNAFREGAQYRPVSDLFSRSAYYAGESYGGIEITSVTGAESFEVCGEDENILSVQLASPLGANAHTTIGISFEVKLAKVNHRLGVTKTAVNLANFYPVLCAVKDGAFCEYVYSYNGDPFVSEIADYDVTLTLPQSYTLASGFAAEAVEGAEEGKCAYHVRVNGVRDIAFVLSENFEFVTENACGVEVSYYYTADSDPQGTLKAAVQSLSYFSETFGQYEYPRYTVVSTDFVYGGMEFPALSMIASDLRSNEIPAVVAHETAHQWWYSMVGNNQFECAWQDEGLAEYSSALFLGAHPEYDTSYRDFINLSEQSYRAFFSVYSQLNGQADTTMTRPLTSFTGEYEYRNIAYDKGVILFDRVREVAGERKFTNALKRYFSEYSGKIASPDDLISCFEHSGANVRALFDSFTEGRCVI